MSTTTTADGWVVILTAPGWHSIHTATTHDAAYHLAAVSLSNEDADAVTVIGPTGTARTLTGASHLAQP